MTSPYEQLLAATRRIQQGQQAQQAHARQVAADLAAAQEAAKALPPAQPAAEPAPPAAGTPHD